MMLAPCSPQETYRKVDFDARVSGADRFALVELCYEQLAAALGTALHADRCADNRLKSQSLTRALSAITALQLGLVGDSGVTLALQRFLGAASRTVLDSATAFDAPALTSLRNDVGEIASALSRQIV